MAGIHPVNGVSVPEANNAYDPTLEVAGCSALYYSSSCLQTLDIDGLNAIISEIRSFVDLTGVAYDCEALDNMYAGLVSYMPKTVTEELVCQPVAATYPTIAQIGTWVRSAIEWSAANLNDVTNSCNRMVAASNLCDAVEANTASIASLESRAAGTRSAVIAGTQTTVTGANSLGVGYLNTCSGIRSIVGGGQNTVSGGNNLVAGYNNTVSGEQTVVAGGNSSVSANNCAVFGGLHTVAAVNALVGGNTNTVANTASSSVVAGFENSVAGPQAAVFGGNNTVSSAASSAFVVGSTNSTAASYTMTAGSNNTNNAANGFTVGDYNFVANGHVHASLFGRTVRSAAAHTTAGGYSAGTVAATANRKWEFDNILGNLKISGTLTSSHVFPGFGEYFVGDIPEGIFAATDDGITARAAVSLEETIGITRRELAIAAGGGIDPANSPVALDAMGNRVIEDVEITQEIDVGPARDVIVDTEIEDVEEQEDGKGGKRRVKTRRQARILKERAATRDPAHSYIERDGRVLRLHRETVQHAKSNPNYNADAHAPKIGVEFMGRCFLSVDKSVKAGAYVKPGAGGIGTESKTPTPYRALSVKDGKALVMARLN